MKKLLPFLVFAPVFIFISCTEQANPQPNISIQNRPIYYGDPDTTQEHQAVVFLYFNSGGACTGTLIDTDVILTAAHCIDGASAGEIYFGDNQNNFYAQRNAVQMIPHPNFIYSNNNIANDIAIVIMDSDAPSAITPIPPLPPALEINSSDEGNLMLTFVGFGQTETGTSGTKLYVQDTLNNECSNSSGCDLGYTPPYSLAGGTISYDQNPGGPCSGDSGGPAFIFRNGNEYIAGITSYGDQNCTQYGVSTKVDYYYSWISQYISGTTAENCTNGIDDDSDGDVDCNDSDCSSHSSCQTGDEACTAPEVVSCGDSINGTTVGAPSYYGTNSCIEQFTEDGPEVAYQINAPSGSEVTVDLTPAAGSDLDTFLLESSCDTDSCIGGSASEDNATESFTYEANSGTDYFVLVETYSGPGNFNLEITCTGGTAEICDNGVDDDSDGAVDCDDSNCSTDQACQTGAEICNNGIDDDSDNAVDCNDADCSSNQACQLENEICDNEIDDDGDGAVDCDDADCSNFEGCQSTFTEICDNDIDDDGDGNTDCDDQQCSTFTVCKPPAEICDNDIDDDGDGAYDCSDPDCFTSSVCTDTSREICDNEIDDDNDGAVDCDDADCNSFSECSNNSSGNDSGCTTSTTGTNNTPTGIPALIVLMFALFLFNKRVS